jgi:hypothetical protein
VIEFLAGVITGVIAMAVGVWVTDRPAVDELAAENRELRECLRRVRVLVRAQRPDSFIGGYIDRVLSDEAGA